MRFGVLGPLHVADDAGRELVLSSRKQRALLAVLLCRANEPVPSTVLVDAAWGETAPAQVSDGLRVHLHHLRRLVGPTRVERHPNGYRLTVLPDELDAEVFRRLVDRARRAVSAEDLPAAAETFRRALALWRGPALEDFRDAEIMRVEAGLLDDLRLDAHEECIAVDLALGRHAEVCTELRELVKAHPLRESVRAKLMLALYRSHRSAEALALYDETRKLLASELGSEPDAELRSLHERMLREDGTLRPGGDPARPVPRQLPVPPQQFTGRIGELTALDEAHDASTVVVCGIDGMAGIGKTALAVHAAHRVADRYPDGQLFIDLHGHTQGMEPVEPGEALDHLLHALGVPGTQITSGLQERAALYRTRLAGRRMLILLDNAATEDQVLPLLPGAPGSLVLVTSRRRLAGLDQTCAVSLDTLPVPDAVALFVRTAGAERLRDQPPALVTELVELCGRLPLAIRIAAARLRSRPSWTLSHLLRRLRDQQHRLGELETGQRSVTAALDLSYAHLEPDQRRAYRLLGLHPGPDIDPYATAALLDAAVPDVARVVDHLLDAHLIQEPVAGRYRFHDLARAHAAHTAARDEAHPARSAALSRLLDHYRHTAALAMDAAYPYERVHRPQVPAAHTPSPDLPDAAAALRWVDAELPNLLAAARYTSEHAMPAPTMHLSAILHRHLSSRGRYHDAEALHGRALAAARTMGDPAAELDALIGLGHADRLQGRYPRSADHFGQALRIARETGHRTGELSALIGFGHVDRMRGRYAESAGYHEQALRLARDIADRAGELDALTGLGHICRMQRRYPESVEYYERALGIARDIGHRAGELYALTGLGQIRRLHGRPEQAADHYEQALGIARDTGHRAGELTALTGLGHVDRARGRHEAAAGHYRRLLDLARESGDRNFEFEAQQGLGRLGLAVGDPAAAVGHHGQALTLADAMEQPIDQARAHDGLAHAHHALQQRELAREHWQKALDILAGIGVDQTDDAEATTEAIRAHLAGNEIVTKG